VEDVDDLEGALLIDLRDATAGDLAALHALDQVCYPPGIAYSKAEMRYYLRRPGALGIVADDAREDAQEDGQLLGFAIAEAVRYGKVRGGHVITIDVAPAARRQGVGTTLMNALESRLTLAGVTLLRLEVAVDNGVAQQFYTGRGFAAKETIRGYYLGKLDALVMEKELRVHEAKG
jgi:[ribosomal protein S18]-alanine N-acetyltransferase